MRGCIKNKIKKKDNNFRTTKKRNMNKNYGMEGIIYYSKNFKKIFINIITTTKIKIYDNNYITLSK